MASYLKFGGGHSRALLARFFHPGKHGLALAGIAPLTLWIAWLAAGSALPHAVAQPPAEAVVGVPAPLFSGGAISPGDFIGPGSCASGACHGGDASAPPSWRNSYTIWSANDPHAQAFAVLYKNEAQQIVRQLGPATGSSQDLPAHQDHRCLGCHSLNAPQQSGHDPWLMDGVSCEACHGPARRWLAEHTMHPNSLAGGKRRWTSVGMIDTKDITLRAEACVKCHVGAPRSESPNTLDVNHDLIAAGHPRLTFELSAYLANMPRHWGPKPKEDEAQVWAVGQIVTARQATRLTAARATAAKGGGAHGLSYRSTVATVVTTTCSPAANWPCRVINGRG